MTKRRIFARFALIYNKKVGRVSGITKKNRIFAANFNKNYEVHATENPQKYYCNYAISCAGLDDGLHRRKRKRHELRGRQHLYVGEHQTVDD